MLNLESISSQVSKAALTLALLVGFTGHIHAQGPCDSVGFTLAPSMTQTVIINGTANISGTVLAWDWTVSDATTNTVYATSSLQNPTFTLSTANTFAVCLITMIEANNTTWTCFQCDTLAYDSLNGWTIITGTGPGPNPPSCQADFTFNQDTTGNCAYCYQFNNTSNVSNATYEWNFGDSTTSNLSDPIHSYSSAGSYTVCLTVNKLDSLGGIVCTDVYCDVVISSNQSSNCTLTPDPGPCMASIIQYYYNQSTQQCDSFTYGGCAGVVPFQTMAQCQAACGSGGNCMASFYPYVDSSLVYTLYLIENSTGSNLSYYWDFGDGTTSTQQYPTHVYSNYGLYDICLTVSDSTNCVNTSCITLLLDSVQKTFSGYTLIVVPQEPTMDIQQYPGKDITDKMLIHPNPTTGLVSIKGAQGIATVYDIYGKVVSTSDTNTLDLSQSATGIYFIRVLDEVGQMHVARVLKK